MVSTFSILGLLFGLLFWASANQDPDTNKYKYGENALKLIREYEAFEAQVTGTIASIIKNLPQDDSCPADDKGDSNGACRKPAPVSLEDFEDDVNSLLDRLENINTVLLALLPVVKTVLESQESKANVPDPIMWSKLNESVELSCDSRGQPLRLCFWERTWHGQNQVVNVDDEVIQNDGNTTADGFSKGKCTLKIQALGVNDTGPWFCHLISRNGGKFTGGMILDIDVDASGMNSDAIDQHIREATNAVQSVSRSNFAFSTTLLEKLPTGENLVFSPFSVGAVLLAARYGARGNTANQIERSLRLPNTIDVLDFRPNPPGFFQIIRSIRDPAKNYNVTLANRLYARAGFRLNREFTRISQQVVDISVTQVDFTDGMPTTDSINSWLRKKTNGKVRELFSPGSLGKDTKLVLVSAIHFKSPWKYPFDPDDTTKASFYSMTGSYADVDMMVSEDNFPYGDLQQLNAHLVSIPYKGGHFSLQVIIPKQIFGLLRILRALKYTTMDEIQKYVKKPGLCEKVKFHLPKFKIESTLDLNNPIEQMGVTDMFSETEADFRGISEGGATKLFVSTVIQKAFFEVDEEGSDATHPPDAVRADVNCMPSVTQVKADRPFYYQIVEESSSAVILAGVVINPNG